MKKYCKHCIYESLAHETVKFSPQEIIFLEGSELTHIYRIKEGLISINRIHPSGDEKIFDILGESDYVALIAALQGKEEYVATAVALNEVTLIKMKHKDIMEAYMSNTIFQNMCLNCAVTRSTMFQDKLFQTTNINTEDRILATLQILAEKFGSINENTVVLKLPFTKTVLAQIIGIRRETLSRKLLEMQKNKSIELVKNFYKFSRM